MRIDLEVKLDRKVDISIDTDVVEAINALPIAGRWNFIAQILNELDLEADLKPEQKEVIHKWLASKLEKL